MKRIVALLIVFSMLSLWPALPASASANLIFEMDLSDYTAENPVVKNRVSDTAEGITVAGMENGAAPELGAISSLFGPIPYLVTGRSDESVESLGVVALDDTIARKAVESDGATIAFWTLSDQPTSQFKDKTLFNISGTDYQEAGILKDTCWKAYFKSAAGIENQYALTDRGRPVAISNMKPVSHEAWSHYVFTRAWNADKEAWDSVVYINGEEAYRGSGGVRSAAAEEYSVTIGGIYQYQNSAYPGKISAFQVYDGALTAQQAKTAFEDSKNYYMELADSMNLVSPAGDMEISPNSGEIRVEFDNFIDEDTIDGIAFTKADGGAIPGGVDIRMQEIPGKVVVIRYGKLDEGAEYTLHISGDVQSANGISAQEQSFTMTTGSNIIMYEDFSGYKSGELLEAQTLPSGLILHADKIGTGENFHVKTAETESGKTKNYLEIKLTTPKEESNNYAGYFFGDKDPGDIIIELGVRGSGGEANRSTRLLEYEYYVLGGFGSGDSISNGGNSGKAEVINGYSTTAKDEFGFLNMRYVVRKNQDGMYEITGTCPQDANVNFHVITKFEQIRDLWAVNQYGNTEQYGNAASELSYLKISKYIEPEVLSTSAAALTQESDKLTVRFNDDMNAKDFNNESIQIVNTETGKPLDTEFLAYDASVRTASIQIHDYFDYEGRYEVVVSGVRNKSGVTVKADSRFPFTFPKYSLQSDAVFNNTGVTVNLYNADKTEKTAKVIAIALDSNGSVVSAAAQEATLSGGGSQAVRLAPAELPSGGKLRVFVWDMIENEARAATSKPYEQDL